MRLVTGWMDARFPSAGGVLAVGDDHMTPTSDYPSFTLGASSPSTLSSRIDVADVFSIIALINLLRTPAVMMPITFKAFYDALTSWKRIVAFFDQDGDVRSSPVRDPYGLALRGRAKLKLKREARLEAAAQEALDTFVGDERSPWTVGATKNRANELRTALEIANVDLLAVQRPLSAAYQYAEVRSVMRMIRDSERDIDAERGVPSVPAGATPQTNFKAAVDEYLNCTLGEWQRGDAPVVMEAVAANIHFLDPQSLDGTRLNGQAAIAKCAEQGDEEKASLCSKLLSALWACVSFIPRMLRLALTFILSLPRRAIKLLARRRNRAVRTEEAAEGLLASAATQQELLNRSQGLQSLPVLADVSLRLSAGEVMVVVGPTGSGKSALLHAIAGEIPVSRRVDLTTGKLEATMKVFGRTAYAGQSSWVRSATIRANILMDLPYDAESYRLAIKWSQLSHDMSRLKAKDQTDVGERGSTLSGGQRARLCFARALYRALYLSPLRGQSNGCQVVVLDDPLAAVDARVARRMFEDGILGLKRRGVAVVLSMNTNLGLVAEHADDIATVVALGGDRNVLKVGSWTSVANDHKVRSVLGNHVFASHPSSSGVSRSVSLQLDQDDEVDLQLALDDGLDESMNIPNTPSSALIPASNDLDAPLLPQSTQAPSSSDVFSPSPLSPTPLFPVPGAPTANGKLTRAEDRRVGAAGWSNLFVHLGRGSMFGGVVQMSIVFFVYLSAFASKNGAEVLLSAWAKARASEAVHNGVQTLGAGAGGDWWSSVVGWWSASFSSASSLYALFIVLVCTTAALCVAKETSLLLMITRSSMWIYERALLSLLKASVPLYFDVTPLGRITNRMTKDVEVCDVAMADSLADFIWAAGQVIIAIACCLLVMPTLALPLALLGAVVFYLQRLFKTSAREIRRLEGVSRSPIFSGLEEYLDGLPTLRAHELLVPAELDMMGRVNQNSRVYLLNGMTTRWLNLRLDFVAATATLLAAGAVAFFLQRPEQAEDASGDASSGHLNSTQIAGATMVAIVQMATVLQWGTRFYCDLECHLASLERLVDLSSAPKESNTLPPPAERKMTPGILAEGETAESLLAAVHKSLASTSSPASGAKFAAIVRAAAAKNADGAPRPSVPAADGGLWARVRTKVLSADAKNAPLLDADKVKVIPLPATNPDTPVGDNSPLRPSLAHVLAPIVAQAKAANSPVRSHNRDAIVESGAGGKGVRFAAHDEVEATPAKDGETTEGEGEKTKSEEVSLALPTKEQLERLTVRDGNGRPVLLPRSWIAFGRLEFRDVCLRYRPDLPALALKNINFTVGPDLQTAYNTLTSGGTPKGELVGICGRSGAGKSSLLQALFRIVEVESGSILIDNIDIRSVGLSVLRSKLAVIPQEPLLFSGTLRDNLDPTSQIPTSELWECLESIHLSDEIREQFHYLPAQEQAHTIQRARQCLEAYARKRSTARGRAMKDIISRRKRSKTRSGRMSVVHTMVGSRASSAHPGSQLAAAGTAGGGAAAGLSRSSVGVLAGGIPLLGQIPIIDSDDEDGDDIMDDLQINMKGAPGNIGVGTMKKKRLSSSPDSVGPHKSPLQRPTEDAEDDVADWDIGDHYALLSPSPTSDDVDEDDIEDEDDEDDLDVNLAPQDGFYGDDGQSTKGNKRSSLLRKRDAQNRGDKPKGLLGRISMVFKGPQAAPPKMGGVRLIGGEDDSASMAGTSRRASSETVDDDALNAVAVVGQNDDEGVLEAGEGSRRSSLAGFSTRNVLEGMRAEGSDDGLMDGDQDLNDDKPLQPMVALNALSHANQAAPSVAFADDPTFASPTAKASKRVTLAPTPASRRSFVPDSPSAFSPMSNAALGSNSQWVVSYEDDGLGLDCRGLPAPNTTLKRSPSFFEVDGDDGDWVDEDYRLASPVRKPLQPASVLSSPDARSSLHLPDRFEDDIDLDTGELGGFGVLPGEDEGAVYGEEFLSHHEEEIEAQAVSKELLAPMDASRRSLAMTSNSQRSGGSRAGKRGKTFPVIEGIDAREIWLAQPVADRGANLSAGQKQLLCMARALLRKAKIIVLDEATANIDGRTDRLVQSALANATKGATVLTIAHRLESIAGYDRILVVEDGRIVENGSPLQMLSDPFSHLRKLAEEIGEQGLSELMRVAEETERRKLINSGQLF